MTKYKNEHNNTNKVEKRRSNTNITKILVLLFITFSLGLVGWNNTKDTVVDAAVTSVDSIFADVPSLSNSSVSGNRVTVVPNKTNQRGAIWTKKMIDFNYSWELDTTMLLGGNTTAADGITISFQSASNQRVAGQGNKLGVYANSTSEIVPYDSNNKGLIVIEFDTYKNANMSNGFMLDDVGKEMAIMNISSAAFQSNQQTYSWGTKVDYVQMPNSVLTTPINVTVDWISNGAGGGELVSTIEGVGTARYTMTSAQVQAAFKGSKAYMGYTGATAGLPGNFYADFNSFEYTEYAVESSKVITHANGRVVDDSNPAYKYETLHVREVIKNPKATSSTFDINYRLQDWKNTNAGIINDSFKVNSVKTAYANNMPLVLPANGEELVIEYDTLVYSTQMFTDATGPQKVGVTTVITSPLSVEENFVTAVATINHAPSITANDIIVPVNNTLTDAEYISKAGVSATDMDTFVPSSLIKTVNTSGVDKGIPGIYDIIYTVTDSDNKSTSVTKKVVVTPNGETDIDEFAPYVYATDHVVLKGAAFDLKAGVFAYDREDGDLTNYIETTILGPNGEEAFDSNIIGEWNIRYSVIDTSMQKGFKDIKVIVVEEVSGDVGYTANDFEIDVSEVAGLTEQSVIEKAHAHAFQMSTGTELTLRANLKFIQATPGIYPVVFSTELGVNFGAMAIVKDENTTVDNSSDALIYGRNFESDKGVALTTQLIESKSGSYAYKLSTNEPLTLSYDTSDVNINVAGVYPLRMSTPSGATHTVFVTIKDENTIIDPNSDTFIFAKSFQVPVNTTLTDAQIITKAEAIAKNTTDGTNLDLTVVRDTLDTTKAGVYQVTFNTTTNASKTVAVIVNDGSITVGTNYVIQANSFEKRRGQVTADAITVAGITTDSLAEVYDLKTGGLMANPDFSVVMHTSAKYVVEAPIGTYPMTISTGLESGLNIIINASVIAGRNPVFVGVEYTEISLGQGFDAKSDVTITDLEDEFIDVNSSAVEITGNVDVEKTGVYVLHYKVTDSDKNVVSKDRVIVVTGDNLVVGNQYIMMANDYTIRKSLVNTDAVHSTTIKSSADLKVYRKSSGLIVNSPSIAIQKGDPQYIVGTGLGKHPVTFTFNSETSLKKTINVDVISGEAPQMSIESYTEISAGTVGFDILDGINITDDHDTLTRDDVNIVGNLDTNAPGVYPIEYSVTDSDGNTTKVDRVIVVTGEGIAVGNQYIIAANNYSIRLSEARLDEQFTNETITTSANVVIYNKADGSISTTATTTANAPTFVKNVGLGDYAVTYNVDQEPTLTLDRIITVEEGNPPNIYLTDFVSITVGNDFNPLEGVSADDDEDGDFLPEEITVNGTINTNKPGVYKLTYEVTDSDSNTTISDTRVVAVTKADEVVVGERYIVQVFGYDIRVGQVDTNAVSDTTIKNSLNVKVYDKDTGDEVVGAATTLSKGTGAQEYKVGVNAGEYPLTISVDAEPTLTVESKVSVKAGEKPVIHGANLVQLTTGSAFDSRAGITITDDFDTLTAADITITGTVTTNTVGVYPLTYTIKDSDRNTTTITRLVVVSNDGESVVGDKYIILAQPYQLRYGQVTYAAVGNINIKNSAQVKVYDKTTGIFLPNEQVSVTKGTGAEEYKFGSPVGIYPLTFSVNAEPTTSISTTVEIITGEFPTISGAVYTEIDLYSTFNARAGVTAYDEEDKNITSEISVSGQGSTNVAGVYKIKYTIVDTDGNKTIVPRVVVVKDPATMGIGDKYIIKAHSYQLMVSDVTAQAVLDTTIRTSSNLTVYDKLTGNIVPNPKLVITRGEGVQEYAVGVEEGDYPITYTLENDTARLDIKVKVNAGAPPVIHGADFVEIGMNETFNPLEGISITDEETPEGIPLTDPTFKVVGTVDTAVPGVYKVVYYVEDRDGNDCTVTRVVVVTNPGETAVGNEYIITAQAYEIRKGQVDALTITDDAIFTSTQVTVFSKETGDVVEDPQLVLTKGAGDQEYKVGVGLGDYPLTLSTALEEGLSLETKVTVISGESPVFTGPIFIEVVKGSDFDLYTQGAITDEEDKIIPNRNAEITGDVVDYDTPGIYKVIYTVEDTDGNKAEAFRIIAVTNPGEVVAGENYVIAAKNYEIRKGQVDANAVSDATILTSGEVIVYDKLTGDVNTTVTKTVTKGTGADEYKVGAVLKDYPLTYSIEEEPTLQIQNKVTVVSGLSPEINGLTYLEVNVGAGIDLNEGVSVTDDHDTGLTFTTNPTTISTATPGVHKVVYTTVDSDGNTVSKNRVVVVKDDNVVVGNRYIITAKDYTLRRGQVTGTAILAQNIKSSAAVAIYDKTTGNLVVDPVIDVVKDAGYIINAPAGNYPMTYKYNVEPGLQITRKAIVITGNAPTINNVNSTSVVKGTGFDPKAGVTVTDDFDTLTAANVNVTGTVDINVPGIYKLTYKVKDSDLNETTVQRVVVVTNPGEIVAGTNYIIKANDYEIRKGLVTDITVGNETIITSANVKVYSMETGLEITNPNITVAKGTGALEYKVGVDLGDYPLTYSVEEEPTLTITNKVSVIDGRHPEFKGPLFVEVAKGDTTFNLYQATENTDFEDGNLTADKVEITAGTFDVNVTGVYSVGYKLTDSDGNVTNVTRVIAVSADGEVVVGDKYIIEANDYSIYKGKVVDATTTDQAIKDSANVKVYSLEPATLGQDVSATTNVSVIRNAPQYVSNVNEGIYNVTFKVDSESTLTIDNQIEVLKGKSPEINGADFIEVSKNGLFDSRAGVTASDEEDTSLNINDVEITGVVDLDNAGIYKLTYKVTDSDRNQTTVVRVVAVSAPGELVVGNEYMMTAKNYSIRKGQVKGVELEDQTIIDKSNVRVYSKETGELNNSQTIQISRGIPEYALGADYGKHPITSSIASDPTLEITTEIDVIAAKGPDINGATYKEISRTSPFDPKTGITVTDDFDNLTVNDIQITGTVNINVVGVYKLEYKVTDSDGNTTIKNRVVVVTAPNEIVSGTNYIIKAKGYQIRKSLVNEEQVSNPTIITNAGVTVYDKTTGDLIANPNITVTKKDPQYLAGVGLGDYPVEFSLTEEPTTKLNVFVKVVEGGKPVINGAVYKELNVGDSFDPRAGITVYDDEDKTLSIDDVLITGSVEDKPGVYKLEYSVTDVDGNNTKVTRVVVVVAENEVVTGTSYIIKANDYEIRKSLVTAENVTDAVIKSSSNVTVYAKATGDVVTNPSIKVERQVPSYEAGVGLGNYPLKLSLNNEPTLSITVKAKVVTGKFPVITGANFKEITKGTEFDPKAGISISDEEDQDLISLNNVVVEGNVDIDKAGVYTLVYKGTDLDGNITSVTRTIAVSSPGELVVGNEYIIEVNPIIIRKGQVNEETTTDQYLVSASETTVYSIETGLRVNNATYTVTRDEPRYDIGATDLVYNFTIALDAEPTLTIDNTITVVLGQSPEITGLDFMQVAKDSTIDYYKDVLTTDLEDVTLTPEIDAPIDTSIPGVYIVVYTAVDSDGNVTEENRVIAVTDTNVVVGDRYIIDATSYTIRLGQVDASDEVIKEASHVKVYDKTTGLLATNQNVTFDKGDYNAEATTIVYPISVSPELDNTISASFNINVVTGGIPTITYPEYTEIAVGESIDLDLNVSVDDLEDKDLVATPNGTVDINTPGVYKIVYSVTDSDYNTVNKTRVVVVVDNTVGIGDQYIVVAKSYTIRLSEVDASDATLVSKGEIKVYDKVTGELSANQNVIFDKGTYNDESKLGKYEISVRSQLDPNVSENAKFNVEVVTGEKPIITGANFIEIINGGSFNAVAGVEASDEEDIDLDINDVQISGDTVDTNINGVYKVIYSVTDSDQNSERITRVVVVSGNNEVIIGDEYIIQANSYEIRKSLVNADAVTDETIKTTSNLKVYSKTTGEQVVDPAITVTKKTPEYVENAGLNTYPIELSYDVESTLKITINVEVVAKEAPVITGADYKEISKGSPFNPLENIEVTDDFDTLTVADIEVTGSVDIDNAGVYKLEYKVIDSDDNPTIVNRVVVVTAANEVVVGSEYIIKANGYEIRKSLVDATAVSDETIISSTNVEVYSKTTGDEVVNPAITVTKKTPEYNVGAVLGNYPVELSFNNESTLKVEVNVKVIPGDAPVIDGADYIEIVKGSDFDPKNGVSVSDTEDLSLSIDDAIIEGTVGSDAGVYKLTYIVTDSDDNETKIDRVVVVTDTNVGIGTSYIIVANSYEIRLSQVDASDATIKEKSEVKVYVKETGELANNQDVTFAKGAYNDESGKGIYSLSVSANVEASISAAFKVNVVAGNLPTIEASTYDEITKGSEINLMENVFGKDQEDVNTTVTYEGSVDINKPGVYVITYSTIDTDLNPASLDRIVVVTDDSVAIGETNIIVANSYTIRLSEVDASDETIKTKSEVKVYDKNTGELSLNQNVTFNKGTYTDESGLGTYPLTVAPVVDNTIDAKFDVVVIEGGIPSITVPKFTEVIKGGLLDLDAGVSVEDDEDKDLTYEIIGEVDINTPGVYVIQYTTIDTDNNRVTEPRVIAVTDQSVVVGTTNIIVSNSYQIRLSEVDASDATIKSKAEVKVYDKTTGLLSANQNVTFDKGTYNDESVVALYPITVSPEVEPAISAAFNVDVITGGLPSIEASGYTEIDKGSDINLMADVRGVDPEDLTTEVTYTGTVNKDVPGVYVIEYSTIDSDSNPATFNRVVVVKDDSVAIGTSHIIVAKSYTIRLSEVDASDETIKSKADVKVYDKTTGELSTNQNVVFDKGTYNDESLVALYPLTVSPEVDPTINAKFNVDVTTGNLPVINTSIYTEINKGEDLDLMADVSGSDVEDTTTVVTYTGTLDKDVSGVYVIKYKTTDGDSNTIYKDRVIVVKDEDVAIGTSHIIVAKSYTIRLSEVDASDATIKTKSEVKVYDKTTGKLSTNQDVTFNKGTYTDESLHGKYNILVSPNVENTINAKFEIEVVTGGIPEITYPKFTEITVGSEINLNDDVSVYDKEDKDLVYSINGEVDINTPGVYVIEYSVTDSDRNHVIEKRVVVVSDDNVVVGTSHVIVSNSYQIRLSEVDASDATIKSKAEVKVYDKETGLLSANQNVTFNKGTYNDESIVALYPITVSPEVEPTLSATFNVDVITGGLPSIEASGYTEIDKGTSINLMENVRGVDAEDLTTVVTYTGTVDKDVPGVYVIEYSTIDSDLNPATFNRVVVVKDDSVGIGNNVIIVSKSYTIRLSQVDASDATIKSKADVKVYDKTTGLLSANQNVVFDKGTYTNESLVALYPLTVSPQVEPTINSKFNVDVTTGNLPVINTTTYTEINKGSDIDLMAGVSGSDIEDKTTVVKYTGTVNKNVSGVYVIKYSTTDSDKNTVYKDRVVVVKAADVAIGSTNIVVAKAYSVKLSEVDASDATIKTKSNVKVYDKTTGKLSTNQNVTFNKGSYTDESPIGKYDVLVSPEVENTISAKFVVSVVTGGIPEITYPKFTEIVVGTTIDLNAGVSVYDEEDKDLEYSINGEVDINTPGVYLIEYSVTDRDFNGVTEQRVVVVTDNNVVVGTGHIIVSKSYSIRLSEVDSRDETIKTKAEVEVYDKDTGLLVENQNVTFDKGTYNDESPVAVYPITVSPEVEPELSAQFNVNVETGGIPVINYPAFTEIKVGEDIDLTLDVSVTDTEDSGLVPTITGTVDKDVAGVYVINYSVTDSDRNTVDVNRVVVVSSDNVIVGDKYIIEANSYTIRLSEVNASDAEIKAKSEVKVYDKATGLLSANQNVSFNKSNYTNSSPVGVYSLSVKPTAEIGLIAKFKVNVVTGGIPEIDYPQFTEISKGEDINLNENVSVSDLEDKNLTAQVIGSVDTNVAGVYVVKYTVTDSDKNTVTVDRVIAVTDETVIVGEYQIIQAESYEIRINEIDSSDDTIKTNAKIKVYDKATGLLSASQNVVFEKGDYETANDAGIYQITVSLQSEPDIKAVFYIDVIRGNVPTIQNKPLISIQVGSIFNAESYAKAIDEEDGVIEVKNKHNVNPNVAGVYVVEYSAQDSDRNVADTKMIVIVNDGTYNYGDKYIIKANSYEKRVGQIDTNEQTIIKEAGVEVYDKFSGMPVKIDGTAKKAKANVKIVIEYGNPSYNSAKKAGVYPITFKVANDATTSKKININIVTGQSANIIVPNEDIIEVGTKFDPLAGVSVKDKEDNDITTSLVVTGKVKENVTGIYPITYHVVDSDGNETTLVRNIIVIDPSTTVYNDDYAIIARSYVVKENELDDAKLSDEQILKDAKVVLYDRKTGEKLDLDLVSVDKGDLDTNSKVGPYKVVFTSKTDPSVSITKIINVLSENTVIGEITSDNGVAFNEYTAITATGFKIYEKDVNGLTKDQIIKLANAYAWNLKNGEAVEFGVNYSQLKAVEGTYQITFTTIDGVSIDVNVEVVKEVKPIMLPKTGMDMNIVMTFTLTLLSSVIIITRKKYDL